MICFSRIALSLLFSVVLSASSSGQSLSVPCTFSHGDVAALNAAAVSGASEVIVPLGSVCLIDGPVNAPDHVALSGPGVLRRSIFASVPTGGGAAVYQNTIPMASAVAGMAGLPAYDQTLGFRLPGVVLSVNPGISITMSKQVGNTDSGAVSAASASSSTTLSFASGPPPLAAFGMIAYDVSNGQIAGGTVAQVLATSVVMSTPIGFNVSSGQTIQFGYPVTVGDVIVFGNYSGGIVNLGNGSKLSNITIDDGNFDGSPNQYAAGAFNVSDWIVERVNFVNVGLYAVQYAGTHRGRIINNRCTVNVPSNKNNNACVIGYGDIFTPGGVSTIIADNHFSGAGIFTADFALTVRDNEVSDYTYGSALFNVNSTIWSPARVTGNYFHDSGTLPDSNATIPFGIGSLPPGSSVDHNKIARVGGPGIYCLGQNTIITGNTILDDGRGAARAGIALGYAGSNSYLNCSFAVVSSNWSGNFSGTTQAFGYDEESGVTGVARTGNNFLNNSTAACQIAGINHTPCP